MESEVFLFRSNESLPINELRLWFCLRRFFFEDERKDVDCMWLKRRRRESFEKYAALLLCNCRIMHRNGNR